MATEQTANVLDGSCRHECKTTWWRTSDIFGHEGDVRRCDHGNLWIYVDQRGVLDEWRRISRFWEPRLHRRARHMLAGDGVPDEVLSASGSDDLTIGYDDGTYL